MYREILTCFFEFFPRQYLNTPFFHISLEMEIWGQQALPVKEINICDNSAMFESSGVLTLEFCAVLFAICVLLSLCRGAQTERLLCGVQGTLCPWSVRRLCVVSQEARGRSAQPRACAHSAAALGAIGITACCFQQLNSDRTAA